LLESVADLRCSNYRTAIKTSQTITQAPYLKFRVSGTRQEMSVLVKVTMRLFRMCIFKVEVQQRVFYTVELAVNNTKILSVSYQYIYGKVISSDKIQCT
jgi:hypothetical protein